MSYFVLFLITLLSYLFVPESDMLIAAEQSQTEQIAHQKWLKEMGIRTEFDLPKVYKRVQVHKKPSALPRASQYGLIRYQLDNGTCTSVRLGDYRLIRYEYCNGVIHVSEYSPYFKETYCFMAGMMVLGGLLGYYVQKKLNLPERIIHSQRIFRLELNQKMSYQRSILTDEKAIQCQEQRDKKYVLPTLFTGLGAAIGLLMIALIVEAKYKYEHYEPKYIPIYSSFFPRY